MSMLARVAAMGAGAAEQTYVDDVFSAYTYTGTGASQTITNGIDLAGKGGLVWIKDRGDAATYHALFDTERGVNARMYSSETDPNASAANTLTAFNSNGFSLGTNANQNTTSHNLISWTFRKAAKFFDIVTYTGNGSNRTISHNLGQVPGMIIVKRMDTTGSWMVYHRSLANTENLVLNTTAAKATNATAWNSTTATTSVFSLGTHADVNTNGGTYVAYLFSHDTAADGIVQCGSFTTDGSGNATVSIGWEPQFVIARPTAAGYPWYMFDTQRNMSLGSNTMHLRANSSNAEASMGAVTTYPTATGFVSLLGPGSTAYIYLAIRRPNKPLTSGTDVYQPTTYTGNAVTSIIGTLFADLQITAKRSGIGHGFYDRLRGASAQLVTATYGGQNGTSAEYSRGAVTADGFARMGGVEVVGGGGYYDATSYIQHLFRRAPGVFDVVCYTGTTSAGLNISHSLGVAPEMFVVKCRSAAGLSWGVYHKDVGNDRALFVDQTAAQSASSSAYWNSTTPTASVFTLGNNTVGNAAQNYVAYLFATKAGISKVGSYTGNGSSQTINCGFTTGARFVLIKRKDSTGDWFVWDTARGIIAGSDPHLSLNTETAEVTTDDSIDPDSSGFVVNQVAAPNINVNGAVYIFLAYA